MYPWLLLLLRSKLNTSIRGGHSLFLLSPYRQQHFSQCGGPGSSPALRYSTDRMTPLSLYKVEQCGRGNPPPSPPSPYNCLAVKPSFDGSMYLPLTSHINPYLQIERIRANVSFALFAIRYYSMQGQHCGAIVVSFCDSPQSESMKKYTSSVIQKMRGFDVHIQGLS